MIGICDVSVQAANPNMPLYPLRAFVNSPSSLRIRNVPKRIGDWNISSVQLVVAYPDNTVKTVECKLIGSVWVGTVSGSSVTGKCENGYTVFASGNDENGNPVSNYALGKGLVEILEADAELKPGADIKYVRIFDEEPDQPKEGDLWPDGEGGYVIWQDGEEHGLVSYDELSAGLSAKQNALTEQQLAAVNSGITQESVRQYDQYATSITNLEINMSEVQSSLLDKQDKLSQNQMEAVNSRITEAKVMAYDDGLNALSGVLSTYATSSDVSSIVTERTQPVFGEWVISPADAQFEIYYSGNNTWTLTIAAEGESPIAYQYAVGDENATSLIFSGAGANDHTAVRPYTPSKNVLDLVMYQDLSNYATRDYVSAAIPTSLSSFNNDVGYVTSAQVEPAGLANPQWAMKALYTTTVLNRKNGFSKPDTLAGLQLIDSIPLVQFTSYYPWYLVWWNGTQFATPVEIGNFGYYSDISVVDGPDGTVPIESYCWMSNDQVYIIKANDVDGIFQPVQFGVRNNISITWYNITLSLDEQSIESVEGITGLTECIRTGIYSTTTRNIAYDDDLNALSGALSTYALSTESQLSVKADISATNLTPIYGGNGQKFSDWSYNLLQPPFPDTTVSRLYYNENSGWNIVLSDGGRRAVGGSPDDTEVIFTQVIYPDESVIECNIVCTRTLNQIIGYKLGDQADKLLASANSLSNYATQEWVMNMLSTWWAEHTS